MTLDLPSLQCWLRARLGGGWQPPTMTRVEPLARANKARVEALIEEVISHHTTEYFQADGWQERAVQVLQEGFNGQQLINLLRSDLVEHNAAMNPVVNQPVESKKDHRNLGW
jgi:hypothetical protein